MLRISGGQPPVAPPIEESPTPETPVAPEAPQIEPTGKKFSADKVEPAVARYMTSDMGPFICANCEHFTGAGDCAVVSGPIDPEGVCILFTPGPEDVSGEATDVEPADEPQPDQPTPDDVMPTEEENAG